MGLELLSKCELLVGFHFLSFGLHLAYLAIATGSIFRAEQELSAAAEKSLPFVQPKSKPTASMATELRNSAPECGPSEHPCLVVNEGHTC